MNPFTIYSVRKWMGVKKNHYYVQTNCGCMIFNGANWSSLKNQNREFSSDELSQLNQIIQKGVTYQ